MPNETLVNTGIAMFLGCGFATLALVVVLPPGLFVLLYLVLPLLATALAGLFLAIGAGLIEEPRARLMYVRVPVGAPIPAFCERCGTRVEWNEPRTVASCTRCRAVRWRAGDPGSPS